MPGVRGNRIHGGTQNAVTPPVNGKAISSVSGVRVGVGEAE